MVEKNPNQLIYKLIRVLYCTHGGSRTLTHIVHYDLNVARLPIPALGYKSYSNVNNLINIKSFLININFNNE